MLATIAFLRWNSTGITVAGRSGVPGNTSDLLNLPYDAVVDYSGAIYIADYNNNRIQRYTIGASSGQTIAGQQNGTAGVLPNRFNSCTNVLVDFNKNIYVTDSRNNRIQYFANSAAMGVTVAGHSAGEI